MPGALRPLLRGANPPRPAVRRDGEQRSADEENEKQQCPEGRSDLVGPPPQRVGVQPQPTCQAPDPLPDATHAVHSVLTAAGIDDTAGCRSGGPPKWVIIPAATAPGFRRPRPYCSRGHRQRSFRRNGSWGWTGVTRIRASTACAPLAVATTGFRSSSATSGRSPASRDTRSSTSASVAVSTG